MSSTTVIINNAEAMQQSQLISSNGRVEIPCPTSDRAWILVSSTQQATSLSIGPAPSLDGMSRFDMSGGLVLSSIFQPPQSPVFLEGLPEGEQIHCFIGTLPEPLETFLDDHHDGRPILNQMLAWVCLDEPVDLASVGELTNTERFELLRGCGAIARRLGFFQTEVALLKSALQIRHSVNVTRLLSYAYMNAQDYPSAIEAANSALKAEPKLLDGPFSKHVQELRSYTNIVSELKRRSKTVLKRHKAGGKVAYCLHNALPYGQGGYAMRSHSLAKAIKEQGRTILGIVRPGFPSDGSAPSAEFNGTERIDGIEYRFENSFGRKKRAYSYIAEAADYYEDIFSSEKIGLVHAATNFWTALPAAIAAYRLRLPFIYEVRSFWSITREARFKGFQNTPQAMRDDALESIVLAMADRVITLNSGMRARLISDGVKAQRTAIAPNCVDARDFSPRPPNPEIAQSYGIDKDDIVVGYIGAMLSYEGLDLLIETCAPLVRCNKHIKVILVGADPHKKSDPSSVEAMIIDQISSLGIGDQVILVDRVAPVEAREFYHLFDICVYPRRAFEVCELVSPLKPLEAMAAGKAVIVSDVQGLLDIVRNNETGLVFKKEDVDQLRTTLQCVIADGTLRDRLGKSAQEFAEIDRSWKNAALIIEENYRQAEKRDGSRMKDLRQIVKSTFL